MIILQDIRFTDICCFCDNSSLHLFHKLSSIPILKCDWCAALYSSIHIQSQLGWTKYNKTSICHLNIFFLLLRSDLFVYAQAQYEYNFQNLNAERPMNLPIRCWSLKNWKNIILVPERKLHHLFECKIHNICWDWHSYMCQSENQVNCSFFYFRM